MNAFARTGSLALLTACVAACAPDDKPITQLILVADTDIVDVDAIQFRVSTPERMDVPLATSARGAGSEPAYVSLVRGEGSLGPLTVTASGLSQGTVRFSRTQLVSFVPDETRVVLLHLFASCLGPPLQQCDAASQTCTEKGCVAQLLGAADLTEWQGAPPRLGDTAADGGASPLADAGTPDAGAPPLTACGPGMVDTQSDVMHCGACNMSCSQPIPPSAHAVNICKAGLCDYACTSGWGSCDGKNDNGCEAELTKNDRCGSCTNKCEKGQMCMAGICVTP